MTDTTSASSTKTEGKVDRGGVPLNVVLDPAPGSAARRDEDSNGTGAKRMERMEAAVKELLECVGEDPEREGLVRTPHRMAKALLYFTKGYQETLAGMI